ncbi:glucose 1-dehydrogenase [Amaricoccus tamworthensis]|uniref:glucose 1-dehydrogenase n=1 Tax=Amaricoccus tamworthensis TaxID=57002 RepID=UPI003C7ADE85
MRLEGKTALITGGASGFGYGIASKFMDEGARVLIADINGEAVEKAASELGCFHVRGDVADVQGVADIAVSAAAQLGNLDILVNNAGVTHMPAPLENISEDEFDRVMRVNVKSVYLMSRRFVPGMKSRGSGTILNIASTAGISPRPNLSWYNASKGWMVIATKTMAVELAPYNVRVNALCPVAGETPLLASFLGGDTPENREKFLSKIPLGRFSTPQDLGNAAAWICSNEADMLTGVAMEIDGGRCV